MKSNKTNLDYLTDISNILKDQGSNELQPDEFTGEIFKDEYEKKNGKVTRSITDNLLRRMISSGKVTKRQIIVNRARTNAYKLIKH
jgi:hypothetical protein